MGRYYSGDIEGKFWFGIMDSDILNRYGTYEENYYREDVDEPLTKEEYIAEFGEEEFNKAYANGDIYDIVYDFYLDKETFETNFNLENFKNDIIECIRYTDKIDTSNLYIQDLRNILLSFYESVVNKNPNIGIEMNDDLFASFEDEWMCNLHSEIVDKYGFNVRIDENDNDYSKVNSFIIAECIMGCKVYYKLLEQGSCVVYCEL